MVANTLFIVDILNSLAYENDIISDETRKRLRILILLGLLFAVYLPKFLNNK